MVLFIHNEVVSKVVAILHSLPPLPSPRPYITKNKYLFTYHLNIYLLIIYAKICQSCRKKAILAELSKFYIYFLFIISDFYFVSLTCIRTNQIC